MSLKLLKNKNYLAMIENSANGENWLFKNLYAEINGQEQDILKNGNLSCAVFVSSILYLNKLIGDLHTTVDSTIIDLLKFGWLEIEKPKPGAVLVWGKKNFGEGGIHGHVGFYVAQDRAISNSSFNRGIPVKHHFTYNDTRKIEKILWHPALSD